MATTTPTVWSALAKANNADAAGAFAGATNEQSRSKVIALADGGYFLTWEDWSSNYTGFDPRDITARLFNFLGTAGTEFNSSVVYNDLDQQAQAAVQLSDGSIAVPHQTTDAAGFNDLENIDVTILSGATYLRHDEFREGAGALSVHNDTTPAIAALADGKYVFIYVNDVSGNKDLSSYIVTPSVDRLTSTRSSEVLLESTAADATLPDAVALKDGKFVAVYQSGTNAGDIAFTLRSSTNTAVASGTVAGATSAETTPQVAALTGGGFVVVWNDASGDGAGNAGVKARVYKADGSQAVATLSANTTTAGVQSEAAVTGLADGGFLIAWTNDATNTVKAQRFDAAGVKVGGEFTAASLNDVSEPDLALLADGRVVLSVTNNSASNKDIYTTILDPRTSVTGTANADVLTSRKDGATVSGLAGADKLFGYNGADKLDGGAGADTMSGGAGNDTYYVSESGDVTTEASGAAGSGTDTVFSNVTRTLGANIENLALTGAAAIRGTGNTLNNVMYGNAASNVLTGLTGNDTLYGGRGNDTMSGSAGNDTFVFNAALSVTSNKDTITDFGAIADTIRLENAIFTALGSTVGTLSSSKFWASTTGIAHDADDRIVYNKLTGVLTYDSNGSAAGGAIQFAVLSNKAGLTHADFVVI